MLTLKNATYIDYLSLTFSNSDIVLKEGEEPAFIKAGSAHSSGEVLDCSGMLVTKSFACGHHHVYSALSRGMGAPKKSPENFLEKLKYIWWTLDKCLDRDMIEVSALITAMACARNGVSFVIDHHASPNAVEGSLEIIAKAFDKVGISHLLCYEISDRDGLDIAEKGLIETDEYLKKREGLVGLHAGFTISDKTLNKAVDIAFKNKSGIHVHTAEDISDEDFSLKKYGKRVVERFSEAGVLNFPSSILAHCIHLNKNERALVKDSHAWVVQNTESNQNNNVGCFTSVGLGERIMLGTDGMHSDMLRTAKATFFAGQKEDNLDFSGIYRRFRNVHQYLHTNNFSGDGADNLVVLDYPAPTPINENNFYGHFLFGIESSHVRHLIAGGKLIVKDRKILNANEDDILKAGREQAVRLWKKIQE